MKKYFILLSVAAFATVACTMEEDSPVFVPSDGAHITFVGNASVETKVSVGEKDGERYPLLWYDGDEISIYSKDATVEGAFEGEKAKLDSDSSGKSSGVFTTENELCPQADMDLLILYPETMKYENGVITGSVAAEQTQSEGDSSIHVGANCFSFAETEIEEEQMDNVSFTLSQQTAFVKVIVSELSDYSDYCLSGVTLKAEGYSLAGDVSYDVSEEEMTVENGSETVSVTITNPTKIEGEQAVYFTALPCDLTEAEILLTVEMTKEGETEPVSITTYVTGGILEASCLSVIKVSDNSLYPAWYDPSETRDLMGGWAYGPQNTYFIEQPTTGYGQINIDVRARGDFSKVKEPKYYGLLVGSSEYTQSGTTNGTKLCYLPNNVYEVETVPTNKVNSDCTIDVYCYNSSEAAGRWALVGIYDEDYNILWSFMVWKYLAGDEPKDVDYGNGNYLLDRIIGAEYSTAMAVEKGTFNPPAVALFQWGRKDPTPFLCYNSSYKNSYYSMASRTEEVTIEYSITHPTLSFSPGNVDDDWIYVNNERELWGGPITLTANILSVGPGHKTIYDPCPEGYRVCDGNIVETVRTNAERWEVPYSWTTGQDSTKINPDSPFFKKGEKGEEENYSDATGECVFAYELSTGVYDYWPYAGFHYNTVESGFNSASGMCCIYSSANCRSNNNKTAFGIQYIYYSTSLGELENQARQRGCAVRCMKE